MRSVGRCLFLLLSLMQAEASWAANPCGMSVRDWCTRAEDGACGRHTSEAACRKDLDCVAVRYGGESLVACHWDARGFADNCPAVGCRGK